MTPDNESAKRRKITRACDCCRAQKKRCTGTVPCQSCVRNSKTCTFLASYTRGRPLTPPPSSILITTPSTPASSHATPFRSATSPTKVHSRPRSLPLTRSASSHDQIPSALEPLQTQSESTWTAAPVNSDLPSDPVIQEGSSEAASDEGHPEGHFVGPGSVHSWMTQAWSCLGRVRQHVFRLHSNQAASASATRQDGSIFSHGDRVLSEAQIRYTNLPTLSNETLDLIITTYFDRGLATYRFLHRPTVIHWLHDLQQPNATSKFPPVRFAIVLLLLALGSAYFSEVDQARLPVADAEILQKEVLFHQALQKLKEETGAPSVESVQARLMQVHYLLVSCRPNRAWYAFGTVVQLVFALGLHHKSYARQNTPGLERELRRRAFWCTYKTDKSLSIALGRPSLIREECITQDLPTIANDEQIFADRIEPDGEDDVLIEADVLQVKLSQIIGRTMREYYETNDGALIQLIMSNNEKLSEWKASLPPFLSGAIKPSSLIPVLRRQATILKLFHLHTIIFINRPLLLKSFSESWSLPQDQQIRSNIEACIRAALEIAKQAVQFNLEGQAFRAFWFSQNMTFNAVSILYLNSLRLLQEKAVLSDDERATISIADEAQESLTNASEGNAPSQRYGIVLEQLRLEVQAHLNGTSTNDQKVEPFMVDGARQKTTNTIDNVQEGFDWTNFMSEAPLHDASMFWPQFDGLPLGFDDWLGTDYVEPTTNLLR